MKNTSGLIIKRRREELKLTQAQLAKALGCSQPNIQKIESGSTPDIRIGLMLEQVLGLNLKQTFIDIGDDLLLPQETVGMGIAQMKHVSQDPLIQAVIDLMNSTDLEGRVLIKAAAFKTLNDYKFQQTTLSKPAPSAMQISNMDISGLIDSERVFTEKEQK